MPTNELSLLRPEALTQLGTLLANAQKALNTLLRPAHLYIGRYGHTAGHALHFHLIPICGWVRQLFFDDPRYRVLRTLSHHSGALDADETEGGAHALRLAGVLREPSSTADLRAFGPRSSRAVEGADARAEILIVVQCGGLRPPWVIRVAVAACTLRPVILRNST
jgi:hypothetical protein